MRYCRFGKLFLVFSAPTQNLLLIRLVSAYKQAFTAISPLDKLEFLAREAGVTDYAFDQTGHYAAIKHNYLLLKRIEAGTKELKTVLNVKIDDRFDRVVHMREFLLFNSADMSINQSASPRAKL